MEIIILGYLLIEYLVIARQSKKTIVLQCWKDEVVRKHVLKVVGNVVCAEVKTLYHSLADRPKIVQLENFTD